MYYIRRFTMMPPFIGASSCIDKTQFIQLIVIANVYIFFVLLTLCKFFYDI